MSAPSVVERVRSAIRRLHEQGAPISLASICEQARQTGWRLSQTSILRNKEARALYLDHRSWKAGPRKRFRGNFRDATEAEIAQARQYWRLSRIQMVALLLTRDAELRLLTQELAALRALERRGDLVARSDSANPDQHIAVYHHMLGTRRKYMAGYWPELLRTIEARRPNAP